jgi:predicted AAA+ superfamily ATPase
LNRKIIDKLISWKAGGGAKPILLLGAKGVGKTYLAYDFAKAFFEHSYYLNLERERAARHLFLADEPHKVTEKLQEHFQMKDCSRSNSVLILDEIAYCPEALTILENSILSASFDYIITISSNPIPKEYEHIFDSQAIYPLEFDEFLRAINYDWYIEAIVNHYHSNTKIPDIVHKELLTLYELYLRVGGMPGIVNEYLNLADTMNVSELHSTLIGSYHYYIDKEYSEQEALKMKQVFDSLVYQLIKDNRKFQYKIIRKGTTYTMYREAIQRLIEQNYVICCEGIRTDQLNSAYELLQGKRSGELNPNFKLYFPDTGLFYSKIIEEIGLLQILPSKKALLENNVAQSLKARSYSFGFWESDSMAKVDFIIAKDQELIPIEIFDSDKTRSKSISVLKQKCDFPYAIKISSKNFDYSNGIKHVPYYAVFCI